MHVLIIESISTPIQLFEEARKRKYKVSVLRGRSGTLFRNKELDSLLNKYSSNIHVSALQSYSSFRKKVIFINSKSKIDAIVALSEYSVEFASRIAEELGIVFTSYQSISLVRDKFRLKRTIYEKDASCSALVKNWKNFQHAVSKVGFPCVLKPRKGAASLNARVIFNKKEADQIFKEKLLQPKNFREIISSEFLVEKYYHGQMYSIEVIQLNKEIKILTICERFRAEGQEVLELGTLMPCQQYKTFLPKCLSFVKKLIKKTNLNIGIYHIEAIYSRGRFFLIEINPRLMGGSLPILYQNAYGENVYRHVLDIYCERVMPKVSMFKNSGMSCMLASKKNHTLSRKINLNWIKSFRSLKIDFVLYKRAGEKIKKTESNHGYLGRFLIFSEESNQLQVKRDEILKHASLALAVPLYRPEKIGKNADV